MQTLYGKGSTDCGISDSTPDSIIFRSDLQEMFYAYNYKPH